VSVELSPLWGFNVAAPLTPGSRPGLHSFAPLALWATASQLMFCHGYECLSSFVHRADRGFEPESAFAAGFQQDIKAIRVDTNHDRVLAAAIMSERFMVIVVHVRQYPRLLRRRKRILQRQFISFNPEDLAKAANEPDPNRFESKERKVMRLIVWRGGREIPN